ncbi:hypothetical protein RSOLAG1IB_06459 [Rhizoctonia solani AG-1 IB]|uniref:C2H2-type domain-containing protein n=1 Tax=Thanatephorus cucumeris (strain AG1-IB / isolate 7/3/14) TaxID=1108050 RepID=A0A0B7F9Q2_THACB|nr:hypothetical protein RSOLAG1IB_06459 [Rhizoctonia solani AG-1 IB]
MAKSHSLAFIDDRPSLNSCRPTFESSIPSSNSPLKKGLFLNTCIYSHDPPQDKTDGDANYQRKPPCTSPSGLLTCIDGLSQIDTSAENSNAPSRDLPKSSGVSRSPVALEFNTRSGSSVQDSTATGATKERGHTENHALIMGIVSVTDNIDPRDAYRLGQILCDRARAKITESHPLPQSYNLASFPPPLDIPTPFSAHHVEQNVAGSFLTVHEPFPSVSQPLCMPCSNSWIEEPFGSPLAVANAGQTCRGPYIPLEPHFGLGPQNYRIDERSQQSNTGLGWSNPGEFLLAGNVSRSHYQTAESLGTIVSSTITAPLSPGDLIPTLQPDVQSIPYFIEPGLGSVYVPPSEGFVPTRALQSAVVPAMNIQPSVGLDSTIDTLAGGTQSNTSILGRRAPWVDDGAPTSSKIRPTCSKACRKIYVCDICKRRFQGRYRLGEHMLLHNEGATIYTCDSRGCKKGYADEKSLKTHYRKSHVK